MTQKEPNFPETKEKHFLFHIFRMDREEHPMPPGRAEMLRKFLKTVFAEKKSTTEGES